MRYKLHTTGLNYVPEGRDREKRINRPRDGSPVELPGLPIKAIRSLLREGIIEEAGEETTEEVPANSER